MAIGAVLLGKLHQGRQWYFYRLKTTDYFRSIHEGVSSAIMNSDCLVFDTSIAQLFADNGNLGINVTISMCWVIDLWSAATHQPVTLGLVTLTLKWPDCLWVTSCDLSFSRWKGKKGVKEVLYRGNWPGHYWLTTWTGGLFKSCTIFTQLTAVPTTATEIYFASLNDWNADFSFLFCKLH